MDYSKIDYSTLVGLIKERNRPSGGIKTVHDVAVNAFIDKNTKALEIGSNTGFTSVNLSLMTGCKVIGVDKNENSIEEAKIYAKINGVSSRVDFIKANVLKLPFKNKEFDVVWASNVTSFIFDKESAIKEYLRVLKDKGTLVVVPIYYINDVPEKIIKEVSVAINCEIKKWNKKESINLFEQVSEKCGNNIELYYQKDFKYLDVSDNLQDYIDYIIKKNVGYQTKEEQASIRERFEYFLRLFNENLKYAGFSILLFQKRSEQEEKELFISKEI